MAKGQTYPGAEASPVKVGPTGAKAELTREASVVDEQGRVQIRAGDVKISISAPGVPVTSRNVAGKVVGSKTAAFRQREQPTGVVSDDEVERIGSLGKAWVAANADTLASLPRKAVIAINVATGEFVSASDSLTALDQFEERFGKGVTAWVHHNDGPITVGGGLWALSSGA